MLGSAAFIVAWCADSNTTGRSTFYYFSVLKLVLLSAHHATIKGALPSTFEFNFRYSQKSLLNFPSALLKREWKKGKEGSTASEGKNDQVSTYRYHIN